METGSQSGRGWLEGGDGEEEREGDLAGPQGSSHILSLSLSLSSSSSPSLFLSPLCFSFNTSPPPSYPWPRLRSAARYSVANPGGRGWGEARWPAGAQRASELELQTNGHFVSLRNGCPRIPLLHQTQDQPASGRKRAASGAHVSSLLLFSLFYSVFTDSRQLVFQHKYPTVIPQITINSLLSRIQSSF